MKEHKHKKSYGEWAGKPNGTPADLERCAEEVWESGGWGSRQCYRKCGHGPSGAYCKQHAKRFEDQPQ